MARRFQPSKRRIWNRMGDELADRQGFAEHFWKHVQKTETCWLWTMSLTSHGYGQTWTGERADKAHRIAYRFAYGEIPQGLHVCHHCDHPACVRPDHLFLGTPKDNAHDMVRKGRHRNRHWGKPACIHGHKFSTESTRINADGSRACRACHRLRKRRYDAEENPARWMRPKARKP